MVSHLQGLAPGSCSGSRVSCSDVRVDFSLLLSYFPVVSKNIYIYNTRIGDVVMEHIIQVLCRHSIPLFLRCSMMRSGVFGGHVGVFRHGNSNGAP